ncbi:response regulator transcription factor [Micrococcus luteus]
MNEIRIVLADDEKLLRTALATLLEMEGGIRVEEVAADGDEAVEAVRRIDPDLLVTDMEMPGLDGVAAVEALRETHPDLPVVMLTRHARPGVLRRALKAGVAGFVTKSAEPEEIADAIRKVHSGQRWIDPDTTARAISDDCPLTDRELDALRATSEGYSVARIAQQLHLAEGTVRNYLSSAMQKTQTSTRHDAARFARRREWL